MISYLRGRILHFDADSLVLETGGVGYEILLPAIEGRALGARLTGGPTAGGETSQKPYWYGQETSMWIYYHAAERQPRPVLIGFHQREDRAFFELLLSVAAVGPTIAARSMTIPVCDYASAIERRDLRALGNLPGIGKRKAEQIVAALKGKVLPFALLPAPEVTELPTEVAGNFVQDVEAILVGLGHRPPEASRMIEAARKRVPEARDVQSLLEEIWRGEVGER